MTLDSAKKMGALAQVEAGDWAGYNAVDNPTAVAPPVLPWEKMSLDVAGKMAGLA